MKLRKLCDRTAAVVLWMLAIALLVLGVDLYQPYFAWARPWADVAIVAASSAAVIGLLLCGYWRRDGIATKLLVVVWCAPVLAMSTAEAAFQIDRQMVLHAGDADHQDLGRHFMVGYTRIADVAPLAAGGLIGGICVTRHNIRGRTAADLESDIARLQAIRRAARLPPLIVAADQEGGIVSHLAPQLTALPALSTLAALPPDQRAARARAYGDIHGRELARLGVTMNLAPVVDLRRGASHGSLDLNSFIGLRAISDDPSVVTEIASGYIAGLGAHHVGATLKHFRGLGRARDDTHLFSARIDTPVAELEASDWRPFRSLLAGSGAQLMVGHASVDAIDPDRPASHSKRVIDGLLRNTWGYEGLVMTDDPVMGAVYRRDDCSPVVEGLNAGVDLLLVAFDGAQYYRMAACALSASARGGLDTAMLGRSRARLNALLSPDSED